MAKITDEQIITTGLAQLTSVIGSLEMHKELFKAGAPKSQTVQVLVNKAAEAGKTISELKQSASPKLQQPEGRTATASDKTCQFVRWMR